MQPFNLFATDVTAEWYKAWLAEYAVHRILLGAR